MMPFFCCAIYLPLPYHGQNNFIRWQAQAGSSFQLTSFLPPNMLQCPTFKHMISVKFIRPLLRIKDR